METIDMSKYNSLANSVEILEFDLTLSENYLQSKYLFESLQGQVLPFNPNLKEDEDEVTHAVFFGENIKRAIKTFRKPC